MRFLEEVRKQFAEKKPTVKCSKVYKGYCYIPIKNHKGVHTEWLFWDESGLRVELHLEKDSREGNLNLFNKLKPLGTELQSDIGEPLVFDDKWRKKWARIYTVKKPVELTEEVKDWAVETMIKFYDVFEPLLDEIDVA